MVTLAITTYNRVDLTLKSFQAVLYDDRITEIVIVDDCSDNLIYTTLKNYAAHHPKIKLFRNEYNLGCYHNKRRAVELSSNDWVILFDSDNEIGPDYLSALDTCSWYPETILAPSFAKPHFDYRHFAGKEITRKSVKDLKGIKSFDAMINTCNFFVNREKYLEVFDQGKAEPWTADTLYFNYCWLQAGYNIYIVPGLQYNHLVHDGSHYKEHVQKTGNFAQEIMNKL